MEPRRTRRLPSLRSGCRCTVLTAVFFLIGGCQSYNWRSDFGRAEQEARETNRHLLVVYKWWRDPDSNRLLSNEVLSDPQVVALFQDTVNLLIDRDFGAQYVQYVGKYGINTFPAVAIVAPNGRYETRTGFIPKDRFIEFARQAKAGRTESGKSTTAGG